VRRAFAPLLLFLALSAGGATLDRIVATVDERAITLTELDRAVLTGALVREPGETEPHFRDRVLSEMIDEYLRYRDALRFLPAAPDPAKVDAAFDGLRERLKKEGRDPEAEFRAAGMSDAEVRASLERQLVVTQYVRDRFAALSFVSPEDIDAEYAAVSDAYRRSGRTPPPREGLEEELRDRIRDRRTAEEIDKWTKDLREKARITLLAPAAISPDRKPTVISRSP
jgi:hypothetical protein